MSTFTLRRTPWLLLALVGIVGLITSGTPASPTPVQAHSRDGTSYRAIVRDGQLVRNVTGPVTSAVQGVAASPVDSFSWSGEGVESVRGRIEVDVDPVDNSGRIKATWRDRNGQWKLEQTAFAPPPHPTGLQVGSSANDTVLVADDPITTNVYLHGDTTAAGPVLPTAFNLLTTWGPAELTLNGKPFVNPFDGPTPNWVAHVMVTEGVRDDNRQVTANDGRELYNPMLAGAGDTDREDLEVHLVWHDAPGPEVEGNFPPPLSFFYHLQFEDVDLDVRQRS